MLFRSTPGTAEMASEFPSIAPDHSAYAGAERERRELKLQLATLHKRIRSERRWERLEQLATYWPVGLGLLLSAFAPALQGFLVAGFPGIAAAVFPFHALFNLSDLRLSGVLAQSLPLILLYAQFPLDGLFARMFLSHRVTFSGVCAQVSCFHFLGTVYLFLVSGAYIPFFLR